MSTESRDFHVPGTTFVISDWSKWINVFIREIDPITEFITSETNLVEAADQPKWRGPYHCHSEQTLVYTVVAGVIVAVWSDPMTDRAIYNIYRAGQFFGFDPGVFHDILLVPGAKCIITKIPLEPRDYVPDDRVVHVPTMEVEDKMMWLLELAQKGKL